MGDLKLIFTGRFSPFRLIFLLFGKDLAAKKVDESTATFRMVLYPNRGVEMKKLIQQAKQFFDLSNSSYDHAELLRSWAEGHISPYDAHRYFEIDGLSIEDVKQVRNKIRSNRYFRIIYDEYHAYCQETNERLKGKMANVAIEKAFEKQLKERPDLFDDQNKDGLLADIFSEADEFQDDDDDAPRMSA